MSENGGPAFPRQPTRLVLTSGESEHYRGAEGMTLRDYFAAKAMQAQLTANSTQFVEAVKQRGLLLSKAVAAVAYEIADAMLKERDK